ncbi:MAG: hypothetical protein K0S65_2401 [Labilithrix sp.]|nr:hypothetical protein [Labilithrix sp.]
MRIDDASGEREAEAGPTDRSRDERLEQAGGDVGRYARPVVRDTDDGPVADALGASDHMSTTR